MSFDLWCNPSSLITQNKNDMQLRMQELSAPLAACHNSCYQWSWCNTLQSELLQQIITVEEYSRKYSVITHDLQDSVHVSLDLQNIIVASVFTTCHDIHWLELTLKALDTTGVLGTFRSETTRGRMSLTNQLPTVMVEWLWMVVGVASRAC